MLVFVGIVAARINSQVFAADGNAEMSTVCVGMTMACTVTTGAEQTGKN